MKNLLDKQTGERETGGNAPRGDSHIDDDVVATPSPAHSGAQGFACRKSWATVRPFRRKSGWRVKTKQSVTRGHGFGGSLPLRVVAVA